MSHLTRRYAPDTMITDAGLQYLKNLRELEELDLYGTRITDAGLASLKDLTALRKLNLLGAAVTDEGLEQLSDLTKLEELNLYRTKITNTGAGKLTRFPRLRDLDLRYTRVSRSGVDSLRAALPKCRIAFLEASPGSTASRPPTGGSTDAIASWVRARGGSVNMEGGQIREVSLASTGATDADVDALASVPTLRQLDLQATEIGDAALEKIA